MKGMHFAYHFASP